MNALQRLFHNICFIPCVRCREEMKRDMYTSVHLAERPKDGIVPGQTFVLKSNFPPNGSDLEEGEVLLKNLYLSIDPAMRGWLNDARSYVAPVQIGEIMRGACVGVVVASRSVRFPIGSYATGVTGWTELAIIHARQLDKVEIPAHGKITDALGVLGLTGLTAYFGIIDVGNVKKGDFVVVSGAAGATGSIVGQIAKLKGATVLGIAGSDAKVQWLRDELGFDAALNYKDLDFRKKFRMATMEMIDVFFDNVGGDLLDLALTRAKPHSRFVMCGGISQYNKAHPEGPKNYLMIISMRIRMQGFIVFDYRDRFAEGRMELGRWLADGKIKRQETLVRGGLKNAERALIDLYKGSNIGKMLVEIDPGKTPAHL